HHHRGHELELGGAGGDEGQLDQLLVALAGALVGELAGRAVGVGRGDFGRDHHVVAEGRVGEARLLGADAQPDQGIERRQGAGGGCAETDLHDVSPRESSVQASVVRISRLRFSVNVTGVFSAISAMRAFCSASAPSMRRTRSMLSTLSAVRVKWMSAWTDVTGHCLRSAYMRKVITVQAPSAEL